MKVNCIFRFQHAVNSAGIELANAFGIVALTAAYTDEGEAWLLRLLDYLQENFSLLEQYGAGRFPDLKIYPLEGTYLAWLDGRALHPDDTKLKDILLKHGVWLDEGSKFGPGGKGFQRINIACPRSLLQKALGRMADALASVTA